jgi:hypothetical protein
MNVRMLLLLVTISGQRTLFHRVMNAKTASVESADPESGRMIVAQMRG